MLTKLRRSTAIGAVAAALVTGGAAYAVTGQSSSGFQLAQAAPIPGQGQTMQQGQPGMMGPGMGRGMMGQRMMGGWGGAKRPRMRGMRGHVMKVMFAIADLDGDGALSFEEVTNVHQRIFNAIDADNDGRVTPEELRDFVQD